jgi:superfamily II DNA or RNA helicase
LKAKDNLRNSIRKGNKRIVLYSPTGSGKSLLAVDLIHSFIQKSDKRIAFIVNRIGLVQQFSEHLTSAGIKHGVVQGQNTYGLDQQVLVCSINTLSKRGMPPIDFAIIDESHASAGSNMYKKAIFSFNNIIWIGLTATPFAKGMAKTYEELQGEPLWQDMVIASTIKELIQHRYLVDCDIYAPSDPDLTGVRLKTNEFGEKDYREDDLDKAVDTPTLIGDIYTHWARMANGKKTFVFANSVAHSKHIVEEFLKHGVKAEHIDGYMDQKEKEPIMNRFKYGDTTVISNVAMLREGTDVPSAEVMILAKPTKSLTAYIQMAGRVLRTYEGKEIALILDHSGSAHELGYPTDDLPLKLCDGEKKTSEKTKIKDEKSKEKKCPQCHFVKKTFVCEKCGFTPVIKPEVLVEEGDLVKLARKMSKDHKDMDKRVLQAWYSQLLCFGKSKGYAEGWAGNQYKNRFGVYPRNLAKTHSQPSEEIIGWIRSRQIAWAAVQRKIGK